MENHDQDIRLSRSCTIVEAEANREMIFARISERKSNAISIDASEVEEADITLVQVLLSAEKSAAASGARLSVIFSAAVAGLFAQAGLAEWPAGTRP